jgi:hypothetical protein
MNVIAIYFGTNKNSGRVASLEKRVSITFLWAAVAYREHNPPFRPYHSMSKSLSLTLDEAVLREVDEGAHALHVPRETFLEQAIRSYTRLISKRSLRSRLRNESALTAQESMHILKEFEAIS